MNIKLVDVDSTIPNLALMKISSYHKSLNHSVTLERLGISYYPDDRKLRTISTDGYDKVYLSAIFKGTIDCVSFDMWSDTSKCVFGGTGIDNTNKLPNEIEICDLDYSIYPDNDTAYGFISRGCDRKCYFCVVPQKEGRTKQVEFNLMNIIRDFKKVKFMDNNFLQLPNHLNILEWLVDRKMKFQFNQGLDIKLITKDNSELLRQSNYWGDYIFAFDDYKYRRFIERQMELLKWIPEWRAKFYCYVHPDMELFETVKRIEWLKQRKILPYVMRDIACFDSDNSEFYTDLAAYSNQPAFFKKIDFGAFMQKRHSNIDRINLHIKMYQEAME